MYQPRVQNILSPRVPDADGVIDVEIWPLFLAIGEYWKLSDTPDQYRTRFNAFISDRVSINPLYADFYSLAARMLREMSSDVGREVALNTFFTNKDRRVLSALSPSQLTPETELEFVQLYVVNEFIALRIALDGFINFGGINYCGYFGGANMAGQSVPYRTAVV
jgi:hypothetical protein